MIIRDYNSDYTFLLANTTLVSALGPDERYTRKHGDAPTMLEGLSARNGIMLRDFDFGTCQVGDALWVYDPVVDGWSLSEITDTTYNVLR